MEYRCKVTVIDKKLYENTMQYAILKKEWK